VVLLIVDVAKKRANFQNKAHNWTKCPSTI
jgi:hypothetical protein